LQIRRKKTLQSANGKAELYEEARQIVSLARAYNVDTVMNDDIVLAKELGIGVHLGQQDGEINNAKTALAPSEIIGRTCHGDVALIKQAKEDGASYAAMGAVFASNTKPNANVISRQQLIEGCQQGIDICVIGGLTAENSWRVCQLPMWRSLAILWICL